jgi:hypothetical protein
LALAALDVKSDVSYVEFRSGITNLKERLERLLGEMPAAPVDVSEQRRVETESAKIQQQRERVAAASGELLGAAIGLVSELVNPEYQPTDAAIGQVRDSLANCTDRMADGKMQLHLTLDSEEQLNRLAASLARLILPQAVTS